jgi:hypothetical protein
MKNDMKPSLMPCCFVKGSCIFAAQLHDCAHVGSLNVVRIAAVCCAITNCVAILRRSGDILRRVVRPPSQARRSRAPRPEFHWPWRARWRRRHRRSGSFGSDFGFNWRGLRRFAWRRCRRRPAFSLSSPPSLSPRWVPMEPRPLQSSPPLHRFSLRNPQAL